MLSKSNGIEIILINLNYRNYRIDLLCIVPVFQSIPKLVPIKHRFPK